MMDVLTRHHMLVMAGVEVRKFNPLQPRDRRGRWTLTGAVIALLKSQGGEQGGAYFDDDRYFDWSSYDPDAGTYSLEVGGADQDSVQLELDDPEMERLFSALSVTRLRDTRAGESTPQMAVLTTVGETDGVAFGDEGERGYLDWSGRTDDGGYMFEVGGGGDVVNLDLTPTEMDKLIASLALSTQTPEAAASRSSTTPDVADRHRGLAMLGVVRTMFDVDDDPWELDEVSAALVAALDLFDGEERRKAPLRIPKGFEGGGRFRSISDTVFKALKDWAKGEGPDNPFEGDALKGVLSPDPKRRREQLRQAAKARGITLRRGASENEIANALLDDARKGKGKGDGPDVDEPDEKPVKKAAPKRKAAPKVQSPEAREIEVENRIRKAYRDLAGRPGAWVPLADLRDEVNRRTGFDLRDDIPRAEVDAALTRMAVQPGHHVIPWDNRKALTDRDRAASVRIGGDDAHAVRLEDPSDRPLPDATPEPKKPAAKKAPTRPERLSDDPAVREVQVENRIREAYRAIQERHPGDWVGLADLRDELGESTPRGDVDDALRRLEQQDGVNIVPESNQKMLTQADRDSAVVIGDQKKHAITIDDPSPRPLPATTPEPRKPAAKKAPARKAPAKKAAPGPVVEEGDEAAALPRMVGDQPDDRDTYFSQDVIDKFKSWQRKGRRDVISDAPDAATPDPLSSLRTLDPEAARDALDLRKVDELKAMIREVNARDGVKLPVSGRKRELVDRLVGHVHPGGGEAAEAPEKATTPRAPARKAAPARAARSTAEHVAALDAMASHEDVAAYLADVKGAELDALARHYDANFAPSAKARRDLIGEAVGFRITPPGAFGADMSKAALGAGPRPDRLADGSGPTLARRAALAQHASTDSMLHEIAREQGFDEAPRVASSREVDDAIAGGGVELFRGVGEGEEGDDPAAIQEQLRTGEAHYGSGLYGGGIYAATDRAGTVDYGADADVVRMALPADARVVDYDTIEAERAAYVASLPDDDLYESVVFQDPGRYAAARGYDAIRVPEDGTYVVLNRSALVVEASPTAPAGRPSGLPTGATTVGGGAGSGRDLTGELDFAAIDAIGLEELGPYVFADRSLTAIQDAQGFNGPPQVVSREEFDRALAAGEVTEAYRGFTGADAAGHAEAYRSGPHWPGFGQYGSGTYVTTDPAFFDSQFGGPDWQAGATIRIGLRSDARVIPVDELRRKLREFQRAHPDMPTGSDSTAGNLGRLAAVLGYDAIDVGDEEIVILNRTAVMVQESDPGAARVVPTVPVPAATTPKKLTGGISAQTDLITAPDGRAVVRKDYGTADPAVAKVQADSEELAALVLDAVGADAPAVRRVDDHTVDMEFVEGTQGGASGVLKAPKSVSDSRDGRLIGLADALMGNRDRNAGNWMRTPDGRIVPIDNGGAFGGVGADTAAGGNPFTRYLMGPRAGSSWASSIELPEGVDVEDLRSRVEALRPEFVRLGRKRWHDQIMGRLAEIERRAVKRAPGARSADMDPETRDRVLALAEMRFADEMRAMDDNQLKRYWTVGEGLKRWRFHPHPWTKLRNLLRKHVGPGRAERMASEWFEEVFGYKSGHRKGRNPVGPG